jgi:hypothetical protein
MGIIRPPFGLQGFNRYIEMQQSGSERCGSLVFTRLSALNARDQLSRLV